MEQEEGSEGSAASVDVAEIWDGEVEQVSDCAFKIYCDAERNIDWSAVGIRRVGQHRQGRRMQVE